MLRADLGIFRLFSAIFGSLSVFFNVVSGGEKGKNTLNQRFNSLSFNVFLAE